MLDRMKHPYEQKSVFLNLKCRIGVQINSSIEL